MFKHNFTIHPGLPKYLYEPFAKNFTNFLDLLVNRLVLLNETLLKYHSAELNSLVLENALTARATLELMYCPYDSNHSAEYKLKLDMPFAEFSNSSSTYKRIEKAVNDAKALGGVLESLCVVDVYTE